MGISRNEALYCFASDDLIGIGMEADAVRRNLHPEGVVTYTLDRRIPYGAPNETPLSSSTSALIEETLARGGTAITLQGDLSPEHTIPWFEALFRTTKQHFPTLCLHGLSAGEVLSLANVSETTLHDTIARLRDSGLDSIPGDDAAILDDAVPHQPIRPHGTAENWLSVHRTAHALGVPTTATMTFGLGETAQHRLNHLEALRQLQQETGGFTAFTPWSFTPPNTAVDGFEEPTAVEYLKTLAISRMYLDNIENVQSNLETQGLKVLQVGLRFGGNDVGSIMRAQGPNAATEEQIRQVIRDAGFRPIQRDALYRTMFLD
jgi:cyclic dehypoxanthinyl futalosine synthase